MERLVEKGKTMATQMIEYMGKIIFDFEKANKLSGDEHKEAFVCTFTGVFESIHGIIKELGEATLKSASEIDSALLNEKSRDRKTILYEVSDSILKEHDQLDKLGVDLYNSKNYEVKIYLNQVRKMELIVCMDPIYFSLSLAE